MKDHPTPTTTERRGIPTNPESLFRIGLQEFISMWALTTEETRRELVAGRIAAEGTKTENGYADLHFLFPTVRDWIARKRKMPAPIRAKVEAAGALERLEQWRKDQWDRCAIDILGGTLTLPDGTVLHDIRIHSVTKH